MTNLSILYNPSNFIKEVKNNLIQIQDRLSEKVRYSIDYNVVKTVIANNRFLVIYRKNLDEISLQFINSDDAQKALSVFMTTLNELKNNTYIYTNNNLSGDIYDPDTFIVDIIINEYVIKLRNTKLVETHSIVAEQVTSIYAIENYVKVKSESTDGIINLTFENSTKAIEGAEKLREAVKSIVDKILPPDTKSVNSFSKVFDSQFTWTLNPDINFNMDAFIIEYYEYVCPDGSTSCAESEKVKQECEGLVEITGNETTKVLDYVTIKFNQPVSGKAIILGK